MSRTDAYVIMNPSEEGGRRGHLPIQASFLFGGSNHHIGAFFLVYNQAKRQCIRFMTLIER